MSFTYILTEDSQTYIMSCQRRGAPSYMLEHRRIGLHSPICLHCTLGDYFPVTYIIDTCSDQSRLPTSLAHGAISPGYLHHWHMERLIQVTCIIGTWSDQSQLPTSLAHGAISPGYLHHWHMECLVLVTYIIGTCSGQSRLPTPLAHGLFSPDYQHHWHVE